MAELFSDAAQAAAYAAARPTYPPALFEALLDFAGPGPRELAVDVATGSGQAARTLAGHYARVVAQDGSAEQLAHAEPAPNLSFQAADAHATGLPDGCADLVTIAQALHWLDAPRFYREVRRILKPSGCFAAWTYTTPILFHRGHPANAALHRLYEDRLGPHWAPQRRHVEAGYAGLEPEGQDFGVVATRQLEHTRRQSVGELVRYLNSWSAVATYRARHPGAPDPVAAFEAELLSLLEDPAARIPVILPIVLLLAKEPRPVSS